MAKLNFEHGGEKFAVKGEWEGDTFTAQAFKGKKPASDPFSIKNEGKKDGAPAEVLEQTVMAAAKADVENGNGVSAEDA